MRADDVATPGRFRTVHIGRESVLITRDRSGSVHAFLNVCRHRGAVLCTEEAGEVRRTFRCPYHAWTYALDGRLTAAPNMKEMPDVDRVAYGLHPLAVREWLGYVWVCLSPDPPPFERDVIGACTDRLGDPAAIKRYRVDDLRLGHRERYDVRAAQTNVGYGARFGPDIAGFTVDGGPGLPVLPGIAEAQDRRYFAITIRPQVFVTSCRTT